MKVDPARAATWRLLSLVIVFQDDALWVGPLAARLRPMLESLRRQWRIELVLVDDGSQDATAHRLRERFVGLPAQVHHLRHSRRLGIGAAQRTGMSIASGDVVCLMDGALTWSPEQMLRLIGILTTSGCDVVTGSPEHPLLGARAGQLAGHVGRLLSPARIYSHHCCFRAYRGEWARRSLEVDDGELGLPQHLVELARAGATILECPLEPPPRRHGRTLQRLARNLRLLGTLARAAWPPALEAFVGTRSPRLLNRWVLVERHSVRGGY